jgi:hypothetical protein
MRKLILLCAGFLCISNVIDAQTQVLRDFDGVNQAHFVWWDGYPNRLDSARQNPQQNGVNPSDMVARYQRVEDSLFASIVMNTPQRMRVNDFATTNPAAPRLGMFIYTDAPATNTTPVRVQIQLGSANNHSYPAGVHSIYEGNITQQEEWQWVQFQFVMRPQGSQVDSISVDKLVIMFNPNTNDGSTYYFDSIVGPEFFPMGVGVENVLPGRMANLSQNYPNPAKNSTTVNFAVKTAGEVSLTLFNMVGQEVQTLANGFHAAGDYQITFDTRELNDGIYFYTLSVGNIRETKKLIVRK